MTTSTAAGSAPSGASTVTDDGTSTSGPLHEMAWGVGVTVGNGSSRAATTGSAGSVTVVSSGSCRVVSSSPPDVHPAVARATATAARTASARSEIGRARGARAGEVMGSGTSRTRSGFRIRSP